MKRLIFRLRSKVFNHYGVIGWILSSMMLLYGQSAMAADLTIVGSFTTPGVPKAMTVSGDYGYVADGSNGLQVVDVKDPSNPVIIGSVDTEGTALKPYLSGNYVYLADYDKGVVIIDVSVPTAPKIVGSAPAGYYAMDVVVAGEYAFVADYGYQLRILNVSDPTKPSLIKIVDMPGPSLAVFVRGAYAYVACAQLGLQIVDISIPSVAAIIGKVSLAYARDVFVLNNYAYVANHLAGFAVVNVSKATSPVVTGTLSGNAPVTSVFVTGNTAFLGSGSAGLVAVDVSNPAKPTQVDSLNMVGGVRSVFVQGLHVYAVTGRYTVNIVQNQIVIKVGGRFKLGLKPLADFPVRLLKKVDNQWKMIKTIKTDEEGYYDAEIKVAGEILVRARDIVLTGQAAINGEVTYKGAPFASAPVRLFKMTGDKYKLVKTVSTDTTGKYNFGKQNAGTYRVDIQIGPPF